MPNAVVATMTSASVGHEALLDRLARRPPQARVVGVGLDAAVAQGGGERLGPLARGGVDDAGLGRPRRRASSSASSLWRASWKRSTASSRFGRSKPRTTTLGVAQAEPLDDLLAHRRRRRRGEGEHGRAPERLDRRAEAQVVGAEVVAPLARCSAPRRRRGGSARAAASSSRTSALASCSGARNRNSSASSASSAQRLLALALRHARVELRRRRARARRSASTWSRCRAISGETTSVGPSISSPAIW